MPGARIGMGQVDRLADAVREKLLAKRSILGEAKGPITIKVIPLDSGGFNIDVTVTT